MVIVESTGGGGGKKRPFSYLVRVPLLDSFKKPRAWGLCHSTDDHTVLFTQKPDKFPLATVWPSNPLSVPGLTIKRADRRQKAGAY